MDFWELPRSAARIGCNAGCFFIKGTVSLIRDVARSAKALGTGDPSMARNIAVDRVASLAAANPVKAAALVLDRAQKSGCTGQRFLDGETERSLALLMAAGMWIGFVGGLAYRIALRFGF